MNRSMHCTSSHCLLPVPPVHRMTDRARILPRSILCRVVIAASPGPAPVRDLPTDDQELDRTLPHTSSLSHSHVPSYTALDICYPGRLRCGLELFFARQNLLDRRHTEFAAEPGCSQFERSLFVKLRRQQ